MEKRDFDVNQTSGGDIQPIVTTSTEFRFRIVPKLDHTLILFWPIRKL